MQSPTDPADRTGTIGVEAFDAAYGAGFQAADDSPHAVECELVEDGGAFVAHRPTDASTGRWARAGWTNREAGRDAARRTPAPRSASRSSTTAATASGAGGRPAGCSPGVRPPDAR